jgi:small subunit ribosomal protein S20
MPNIKSSSKRVLLTQKATAKNKAARSLIKTNIKKFDAAAALGDRESAETAYKAAVKTVDRAATKGLIHKNKAAHRKSALTKKLNSIGEK